MKRDQFLLLFGCVIALSLFLFASGYAEAGTVSVACVDDSGKALKGVVVELLPLGNTDKMAGKSDKKGIVEFNNIAGGVYRVVGRKDDYGPEFHEFLTGNTSPESVSLRFRRGLDRKLYFENPEQIQRSYDLIKQGIDASKENQPDNAEKALRESIRLNPAGSQGFYYLGLLYIKVGKFDQSLEYLEKAEKLAAMFAVLPSSPGKVDPAQEAKIRDEARSLINNMSAIRGQFALEAKKYEEAVSFFTQAVKDNPDNPDMRYRLALALAYAERLDEGMKEIEAAIRLKPEDTSYADLKVQIAARIENIGIGKAQELLGEGDKLRVDGNADGALEKYHQALNLLSSVNQATIWMKIGQAQVGLNRKDEAESSFKKAVELASEDKISDYVKALAQFYLDSRKYEDALDTLTGPRISVDGNKENTLMDLAEKMKNKAPGLAEIALERVIQLNPGNAEAHFFLGQLYFADGKGKDARTKELLKKYMEIGKDSEKTGMAEDMLATIAWRSK